MSGLAQAGAFAEGGSLSGFSGGSGLGGGLAVAEAIHGLSDPGANDTYAAPTGELGQGGLYNEGAAPPPEPAGENRLACFDDFCGSWGTPELDGTAREAAVTGTAVGMELAATLVIPELAVSRLVWLLRVWRTMRGVEATLQAAVGSAEVAKTVSLVLKGRQPLSALTIKQRAYAAAFYRDVATRTAKQYAVEASRYNIARAEFLEGTRATLPPSLPEFIKAGL